MTTHPARRLGAVLCLLVAGAVAAVTIWWTTTGGRWYVVESPSMGTVAPVGSLLWVRPLGAGEQLRVGEFVTFRPPGSSTVYSHRVYALHPDGTISTKGVLSAPDPWRIGRGQVLGRVAAHWTGVGWVVTAGPVLLGGLAITLLAVSAAHRFARRRWRQPIVMLGASLTVSLAIIVYQPLSGAQQIGGGPSAAGGRTTVVSTGLLPVRVDGCGGTGQVLRAGQVADVLCPASATVRRVGVTPDVPWQLWVLLVVGGFAPAAGAGLRRRMHHARHALAIAGPPNGRAPTPKLAG